MSDTPKIVVPSAAFSRRLTAVVGSPYWGASRPAGPGWEAGPDWPPGSNTDLDAVHAFDEQMLDERDALRDGCAKYAEYDDLPAELKAKVDLVERFNEFWHDQSDRAEMQESEDFGFVPSGPIPLTADERKRAKAAADQARADKEEEVAKWFEEAAESNPNAVREALARMGAHGDDDTDGGRDAE